MLIWLLVFKLFPKRFDQGAKPASIAPDKSRVFILLCLQHRDIFNLYVKNFCWLIWPRNDPPEDFNIRKFT